MLANAGATLPKRDAVDERIIKTVRTGVTTAKPGPKTRRSKLSSTAYTQKVHR